MQDISVFGVAEEMHDDGFVRLVCRDDDGEEYAVFCRSGDDPRLGEACNTYGPDDVHGFAMAVASFADSAAFRFLRGA
jgi:hypothetical protein